MNYCPSSDGVDTTAKVNVRNQSLDVPYYTRALAMGLPAIMFGLQLPAWLFFVRVIREGHGDFRQLYTAGYMLRTGHARQLYEYAAQKHFQDALISPEQIALPFNHLSYESLVFAPLSLLSYQCAYCVFLMLNLLLIWACYQLLLPYLEPLAGIAKWLPVTLFFAFIPVGAALMQGQDSVVMLLLFCLAFRCLAIGRPVFAGAWLAFGLFKFQIVLPVALLFVVWRRWRFVSGFALSGLAVAALSAWLVGLPAMRDYANMLLSMSSRLTAAGQFTYGVLPNEMPNLRGLTYALGANQLLVPVLSTLLLGTTAIMAMKRGAEDQFLFAIPASLLVSYHLLIHDMSVLVLPIALILARSLIESRSRTSASVAALFISPVIMSLVPSAFFLASMPILLLLYRQLVTQDSTDSWNLA